MRKLLSSLHAFPPVLDTLHAFGKKRADQERTGPRYSHRKGSHGKLIGMMTASHLRSLDVDCEVRIFLAVETR